MRRIRVCIQAQIITEIEIAYGESVEEFENREVDLCLHGPVKLLGNAHIVKEDLGSDKAQVIVLGKRW
jgi:hypothetical protein